MRLRKLFHAYLRLCTCFFCADSSMASSSIWRARPLSTEFLSFAASSSGRSQPSATFSRLAGIQRHRHHSAAANTANHDLHWLLQQLNGRRSRDRGWQYHRSGNARSSSSRRFPWPGTASLALIPFSVIRLDDGNTYNNPDVAHNLRGSDVEDPNELHLPGHEDDLEDDAYRHANIFKKLWILFNRWIVEPLGTGRRFLYLAFLFLPVIATAPILALEWLDKNEVPHVPRPGGSKQRRDKERRTSRWWYRFLVKQMERAGPTFIKVKYPLICLLASR